MIIIETMFTALADIKRILLASGVIDGQTLSPEQLKAEKNPIFWSTQVTSNEAGSKEIYLVYNLGQCKPNSYGDGKQISAEVTAYIDVYTNKLRSNLADILNEIANQFTENHWSFELSKYAFDGHITNYQFLIKAVFCL